MKTITAYQADDGTIHETPESAANADKMLAYRQRVQTFVAASPATYEGSRALESWLLTDTGYAHVLALAGVS